MTASPIKLKFNFVLLTMLLLTSPIQAEQTTSPTTQNNTTTQKTDPTSHQKIELKPEINNKNTLGINLGYSHGVSTTFRITNPNISDPRYDTKARFRGASNSPYLTVTTGNLAPNDLNWQIVIEAGHSKFDLSTQESDSGKIDYGTFVEGHHTYIMPQIFYSTSGIGVHQNKEHGFHLGGGIGLGLLRAKGTAVYTDKATVESANPYEVHSIDLNAMSATMMLFVEYRYYGVFIRAQNKMSFATDDGKNNENNDEYEYRAPLKIQKISPHHKINCNEVLF